MCPRSPDTWSKHPLNKGWILNQGWQSIKDRSFLKQVINKIVHLQLRLIKKEEIKNNLFYEGDIFQKSINFLSGKVLKNKRKILQQSVIKFLSDYWKNFSWIIYREFDQILMQFFQMNFLKISASETARAKTLTHGNSFLISNEEILWWT